MKRYRCLVKKGHVGTGRYVEKWLIIQAPNIIQAIEKAKTSPGVKKSRNALLAATSIISVQPI